MTLAELVGGMLAAGVATSAALSLLTVQRSTLTDGSRRLGALRTLRSAADVLVAEVSRAAAPAGTDPAFIVRSGPDEVAFRSTAGMVAFSFEPDPSTPRPDDVRLVRRREGEAPEVLATGLLRDGARPFFTVEAGEAEGDGWGLALRVRLAAGGPGSETDPGDPHPARLARWVPLPGTRMPEAVPCGEPPAPPLELTAAVGDDGWGRSEVRLRWSASDDDGAGESDVVAYTLDRSVDRGPWTTLRSLPAGRGRYQTVDATVESGHAYRYAVSARDCATPSTFVRSQETVVP